MLQKVKIIEPNSNELLREFPIDKLEDAYAYCTQLETMGVEAKLIAPSLPETLIRELGAGNHDVDKLKENIEQEIEDHDTSIDSCCFKESGENETIN